MGLSKIIFRYTLGTQENHRRPIIAMDAQSSSSLVGAMFEPIRASQSAMWTALSRRQAGRSFWEAELLRGSAAVVS